MHARFVSVFLPATLLLATLAGCAQADPEKFARADFTAEERADFRPKFTGDSAMQKFEWPLRGVHHVRLVLESSDDGGVKWKTEHTEPYQPTPLLHVTLLMRFEQPRPVVRKRKGLGQAYLTVRLGGRGRGTQGWSESVFLLEFPGDRVDWTTPDPRPELVLQLKSENKLYRVRLETQDKPWPKF